MNDSRKLYKPSMFNYMSKCDDSNYIIYNSYTGLQGVRVILPESREYVLKLLSEKEIHCPDCEDEIFTSLVNAGYIVPIELDEKLKRDYFETQLIMNPDLYLVIHTSKQCNFRCKYCALDFTPDNMSIDVQNGIIDFIRQNISKYRDIYKLVWWRTVAWYGCYRKHL